MFSTDACLAGCGGVCYDQYFHGCFSAFNSWTESWRQFFGTFSIVVALELWGARWTGLRITVRCDNEAAVTVVNTGWCCNPFMNSCLRAWDLLLCCPLRVWSLRCTCSRCIESFRGSSLPMVLALVINKGTILTAHSARLLVRRSPSWFDFLVLQYFLTLDLYSFRIQRS